MTQRRPRDDEPTTPPAFHTNRTRGDTLRREKYRISKNLQRIVAKQATIRLSVLDNILLLCYLLHPVSISSYSSNIRGFKE